MKEIAIEPEPSGTKVEKISNRKELSIELSRLYAGEIENRS